MRRYLVRLAAMICLGAGGCGSETAETATPPDPVTTAPIAPAPRREPPAPSGTLTVSGPPVTVEVAALMGYAFAVDTAGEYQLEAAGAGAEIWLLGADGLLATERASAEDAGAELASFLAPGSYEVRVSTVHGGAIEALVSLARLEPMEAVATYAPGLPAAMVQCPAGESARASSAEVELTITAPGNFNIDAITVDSTFDPELQLIEDGALLASDSSSGGGTNARIVRALSPGTYRVRVRDGLNRAAGFVVSLTLLP